MARGKKRKTYRKKNFKILNALESVVYLGIITRGTTGGGIAEFVTGEGDLTFSPSKTEYDYELDVTSSLGSGTWSGTSQISLKDLMMNPTEGVNQIASNLSSNLLPMAVAGVTTSVLFNVSRRLLRKPINRVNNDLIKPILGSGIRL